MRARSSAGTHLAIQPSTPPRIVLGRGATVGHAGHEAGERAATKAAPARSRAYWIAAAAATALIVIGGAILTLTFERAASNPTYDYAQMTACLDERGFPFNTLAEARDDLRFCVGFDQNVHSTSHAR